MTVLVAAVIVHDRATDRVVLLQRGQDAKFAQGKWDLPVGKNEPGEPENREPHKHAQVRWVHTGALPEAFVDATAGALRHYLNDGPEVPLAGWPTARPHRDGEFRQVLTPNAGPTTWP